MVSIAPPTTVAVPNAPLPPPPVNLTLTRVYPEPPRPISTLFTLNVILNVAPVPIVDPPLLLVAVVVTVLKLAPRLPGNVLYLPALNVL